jgi:hypothetical protein
MRSYHQDRRVSSTSPHLVANEHSIGIPLLRIPDRATLQFLPEAQGDPRPRRDFNAAYPDRSFAGGKPGPRVTAWDNSQSDSGGGVFGSRRLPLGRYCQNSGKVSDLCGGENCESDR